MTRAGGIRVAVIGGAVGRARNSVPRRLDRSRIGDPAEQDGGGRVRVARLGRILRGHTAHPGERRPRAARSPLHSAFSVASCSTALPRLRRAIDPLLASYYAVPTFMFYPLFIVLFGLNRWPLVAIGFLFAVVAMMLNTLNGFDRVPRGAEQDRARDAAHPDTGNCADHTACLRPLHLYRREACHRVFLHRCHRRRVRALRRRLRFQDRVRLQQFRQPHHVRTDAAAASARRQREHVAVLLGAAPVQRQARA